MRGDIGKGEICFNFFKQKGFQKKRSVPFLCFFVMMRLFGLMIFFRELNRDLLVTNDKIVGLSHEGTSRSLGCQELNDREPFDGSVVGAVLVLVFRDVDVADGAILLKDAPEFIRRNVAGQISSDNGFHTLWIVDGLRVGRENGRRWRSRDLLVTKVKAIQLRIDRREISRSIIRLKELIQLSFLLSGCDGIIPFNISLEQIRDQRILQGLHAENKVELLDGSHGRME